MSSKESLWKSYNLALHKVDSLTAGLPNLAELGYYQFNNKAKPKNMTTNNDVAWLQICFPDQELANDFEASMRRERGEYVRRTNERSQQRHDSRGEHVVLED